MPAKKNQFKQPPSRESERVGGKEPSWQRLPDPDDLLRTGNFEKRSNLKTGAKSSSASRQPSIPSTSKAPRRTIPPSPPPIVASTSNPDPVETAMIIHPSPSAQQASSGMELVLHPSSSSETTILPGSYPSQELVPVNSPTAERQITTLTPSVDGHTLLSPADAQFRPIGLSSLPIDRMYPFPAIEPSPSTSNALVRVSTPEKQREVTIHHAASAEIRPSTPMFVSPDSEALVPRPISPARSEMQISDPPSPEDRSMRDVSPASSDQPERVREKISQLVTVTTLQHNKLHQLEEKVEFIVSQFREELNAHAISQSHKVEEVDEILNQFRKEVASQPYRNPDDIIAQFRQELECQGQSIFKAFNEQGQSIRKELDVHEEAIESAKSLIDQHALSISHDRTQFNQLHTEVTRIDEALVHLDKRMTAQRHEIGSQKSESDRHGSTLRRLSANIQEMKDQMIHAVKVEVENEMFARSKLGNPPALSESLAQNESGHIDPAPGFDKHDDQTKIVHRDPLVAGKTSIHPQGIVLDAQVKTPEVLAHPQGASRIATATTTDTPVEINPLVAASPSFAAIASVSEMSKTRPKATFLRGSVTAFAFPGSATEEVPPSSPRCREESVRIAEDDWETRRTMRDVYLGGNGILYAEMKELVPDAVFGIMNAPPKPRNLEGRWRLTNETYRRWYFQRADMGTPSSRDESTSQVKDEGSHHHHHRSASHRHSPSHHHSSHRHHSVSSKSRHSHRSRSDKKHRKKHRKAADYESSSSDSDTSSDSSDESSDDSSSDSDSSDFSSSSDSYDSDSSDSDDSSDSSSNDSRSGSRHRHKRRKSSKGKKSKKSKRKAREKKKDKKKGRRSKKWERPKTIPANQLPIFDPDEGASKQFCNHLKRLKSMHGESSVVAAIPSLFKDSRSMAWFSSHTMSSSEMSTLKGWIKALKKEFVVNSADAMRKAIKRRYEPGSDESVLDYYYDKVNAWRSANKHCKDAEIVKALWLGLPEGFQYVLDYDEFCSKNLDDVRSLLRNKDKAFRNTWKGKEKSHHPESDEFGGFSRRKHYSRRDRSKRKHDKYSSSSQYHKSSSKHSDDKERSNRTDRSSSKGGGRREDGNRYSSKSSRSPKSNAMKEKLDQKFPIPPPLPKDQWRVDQDGKTMSRKCRFCDGWHYDWNCPKKPESYFAHWSRDQNPDKAEVHWQEDESSDDDVTVDESESETNSESSSEFYESYTTNGHRDYDPHPVKIPNAEKFHIRSLPPAMAVGTGVAYLSARPCPVQGWIGIEPSADNPLICGVVDTGGPSFIDKSLIPRGYKVLPSPLEPQFRGVSESTVGTKGYVVLPIYLPNAAALSGDQRRAQIAKLMVEFQVLERCTAGYLIGRDALRPYHAIVDEQRDRITFPQFDPKIHVPFADNLRYGMKHHDPRVYAAETIQIPPRGDKWITIRFDRPEDGTDVLLSPVRHPDKIEGSFAACPYAVLSAITQEVMLVNPCKKSVTIKEGEIIGTLQPFHSNTPCTFYGVSDLSLLNPIHRSAPSGSFMSSAAITPKMQPSNPGIYDDGNSANSSAHDEKFEEISGAMTEAKSKLDSEHHNTFRPGSMHGDVNQHVELSAEHSGSKPIPLNRSRSGVTTNQSSRAINPMETIPAIPEPSTEVNWHPDTVGPDGEPEVVKAPPTTDELFGDHLILTVDPFGLEPEFREQGPFQQVPSEHGNESDREPDDLDWDICPELTRKERRYLKAMLRKHLKVFAGKLGRLGKVDEKFTMHIDADEKAIKSKPPYRQSPLKKRHIDDAVDRLLSLDIIEHASSPITSPVVVVIQHGKPRFCLDLREVNSKTVADKYAIPKQDEIFNALLGAIFFTLIDANKGYHQFLLSLASRKFTGFVTDRGMFWYKRVPFGLKNAPSHFQRAIDTILGRYKFEFALAYIDDIIIYSKTLVDHIRHVALVLQALERVGMTLDEKKCHFGYQSLKLLGHRISRLGLSTLKEKVETIQALPFPRTIKDAMMVMGLFNYYRNFIPFFAWIAAPIYEGLKGTVEDKKQIADLPAKDKARARGRWAFPDTEEIRMAFQLLKDALVNAPTLIHPDFSKEFSLYTDACRKGVAAVLQQISSIDGLEHPILYISRRLNSAEFHYASTELECLAVVWSLDKLSHYLDGTTFKLFTDHAALKWIWSIKPEANARLFRWSLILNPLKDRVEIIHRPGRMHANVDVLSRNPISESFSVTLIKLSDSWLDKLWNAYKEDRYFWGVIQGLRGKFERGEAKEKASDTEKEKTDVESEKEKEKTVIEEKDQVGKEDKAMDKANEARSDSLVDTGSDSVARNGSVETRDGDENFTVGDSRIQESYVDSTVVGGRTSVATEEGHEVLEVKEGTLDDPQTKATVTDGTFTLIDKALYFSERGKRTTNLRLCIPESLVKTIIHQCHDLIAHPGIRRTYLNVASRFYIRRLSRRIKEYVNECPECQLSKPSNDPPLGNMYPIPTTDPLGTLSIDFITGLPMSEDKNALMTVTDKYTKAVRLIPCNDTTTAEDAARLFLDYCYPIFGLPTKIISDRDSRFTSAFWSTLMDLLGIDLGMTSAFHPAADGQAEKSNQTVEIALRCFLAGDVSRYDKWVRYLPVVEFEYNNTPQSSTEQSPNELRFAMKLRGIPDAILPVPDGQPTSEFAHQLHEDLRNRRDEARDAIAVAQRKQKAYADRGKSRKVFEVGDLVLLRYKRFGPGYKPLKVHRHKLGPLSTPLRVLERLSPNSYRLDLPEGSRIHDVVSVVHLRRFNGSGEGIRPLPVIGEAGEDEAEWEVEKIIGARKYKGRVEYLVKWLGYGEHEASWIQEEDLEHAQETIADWRNDNPEEHERLHRGKRTIGKTTPTIPLSPVTEERTQSLQHSTPVELQPPTTTPISPFPVTPSADDRPPEERTRSPSKRQCEECSQEFPSRSQLFKHIANDHPSILRRSSRVV